jgi:hypothetical protein
MLRLRILARRFGFTPYTSPANQSISPNREERWKYIFSESLKAPLAFFSEDVIRTNAPVGLVALGANSLGRDDRTLGAVDSTHPVREVQAAKRP